MEDFKKSDLIKDYFEITESEIMGQFNHVYQFKVILKEVNPVVWRRIQVPENYTFWDLHVAIQDAMGWLDCHLHEFRIIHLASGVQMKIGLPDPDELNGKNPLVSTSDVVCDFLKRFEEIYENLETGQKRLLIQSLVKEIVVKNRDECSAVLTIPLPAMPHYQNGKTPSKINIPNGNLQTSYPLCPNWGRCLSQIRTCLLAV